MKKKKLQFKKQTTIMWRLTVASSFRNKLILHRQQLKVRIDVYFMFSARLTWVLCNLIIVVTENEQ